MRMLVLMFILMLMLVSNLAIRVPLIKFIY